MIGTALGAAPTLLLAFIGAVFWGGEISGKLDAVDGLRAEVNETGHRVEEIGRDVTALSGRLEMLERRLYDHQVLPQSEAHRFASTEPEPESESTEDEGRGPYRPLLRFDAIPRNSLVDLTTRSVRPIEADDEVATYSFVTAPEGATITMDRMLLGRTPLTVRFTSDSQPFHIRVGKDGYRAKFQNIGLS